MKCCSEDTYNWLRIYLLNNVWCLPVIMHVHKYQCSIAIHPSSRSSLATIRERVTLMHALYPLSVYLFTEHHPGNHIKPCSPEDKPEVTGWLLLQECSTSSTYNDRTTHIFFIYLFCFCHRMPSNATAKQWMYMQTPHPNGFNMKSKWIYMASLSVCTVGHNCNFSMPSSWSFKGRLMCSLAMDAHDCPRDWTGKSAKDYWQLQQISNKITTYCKEQRWTTADDTTFILITPA